MITQSRGCARYSTRSGVATVACDSDRKMTPARTIPRPSVIGWIEIERIESSRDERLGTKDAIARGTAHEAAPSALTEHSIGGKFRVLGHVRRIRRAIRC